MVRMVFCGNTSLKFLKGKAVSDMVNKYIKEIEERGLIFKDVKIEELNDCLYVWILYEDNSF